LRFVGERCAREGMLGDAISPFDMSLPPDLDVVGAGSGRCFRDVLGLGEFPAPLLGCFGTRTGFRALVGSLLESFDQNRLHSIQDRTNLLTWSGRHHHRGCLGLPHPNRETMAESEKRGVTTFAVHSLEFVWILEAPPKEWAAGARYH
jgi:hypothetical protein